MASPCAARVAATPGVGASRVRRSAFGASRANAPGAPSSCGEPSSSRSRWTPSARPVLDPSGRDTHVAFGVAPYARDGVTRDAARTRGSGDAAKRERTAKHTFHTEHGRRVYVEVIPVGESYLAKFEVAEDVTYDLRGEPVTSNCGELSLHWGMHREWLDEWMTLPELPSGSVYSEKSVRGDPRGKSAGAATSTPLVRDGDRTTVEHRSGFPLRFARTKFEIPSYYAPLEMNFVLVERKPDNEDGTGGETVFDGPRRKTQREPPKSFAVPVGAAPGCATPLGVSRASSLGPTSGPGWVNFALHSSRAQKVTLFLQYKHAGDELPETMEFALNCTTHKTGDVWHVALPVGMRGAILPMPCPGSAISNDTGNSGTASKDTYNNSLATVLYGWKCDGDVRAGGWRFHPGLVLFDPRATSLRPPLGAFEDTQTVVPALMGSLADVMNGDDANAYATRVASKSRIEKPRRRRAPGMEVAYELSISDFTSHVSFLESLGTDSAFPNASPQGPANGVEPGTYAAVLAKVNHIVGVGATTVLLLPVQACLNRDGGDNFGQNPISLFACDSRLAGARATSGEPAHQLRQLIRGLQRHGLEVLMHVSLTHLGEGSDDKPNTNSLRGIDAESYYQLGPTGRVEMNNSIDPTACVLNPCSLVTQQFVVDALRHWRVQMGVDGFVVDSGGGIARGTYGRSLLLESIANDPVLGGGEGGHHGGGAGAGGGVRLFLTPGEFEVGRMQNWGVWGERVTPAYARDVGAFLEGKNGAVGGFAARVCGSADLIRGERSAGSGHVMNSWTSFPFGGTLADFAKGVAERAGVTPENAAAHARSKTHRKAGGISGRAPVKTRKPLDPTPGETALVVRAMLATLFLSDGVPVVNAGDEYGHSLRGLEDAPKTWKNDANAFRWDAVGVSGSVGCEIGAFLSACASFRRRRHDLFGFGGGNVLWSDLSGEHSPDWEAPTSAPQLMCRRRAATAPGAVAVASVDSMDSVERVTQDAVAIWNCGSLLARAVIGQPPIGYTWVRVLDTALASPADCELAYVSLAGPQGTYLVAPHAVVLLELAPAPEGTAPTTEQVQAARAVEERRAARIPDAARAAPIPTQTRAPTQTTRTPDRQPLEQTPQTAPQTTPPPQTQPQTMQPPPGEFRPPTDPGQTARPNMPAARPQTPSSNPTFRPPP